MKKQREKIIIYSHYDFNNNRTTVLYESGRIIEFTGFDVFSELHFEKKFDYIIFSNVVYFLAHHLYRKHCEIDGEHEIAEKGLKEPMHLVNTYFKNVQFRNLNHFLKGGDIAAFMKATGTEYPVFAIKKLIESIGNPADVKYSISHCAYKQFVNKFSEQSEKWNKEHHHYYYNFNAEYSLAMCGPNSGLLSKIQTYKKDVLSFDMSSAYVSVFVNDDVFPIGRLRSVTGFDFCRIKLTIMTRLKNRHWFSLIYTGSINGFFDFYDDTTGTTVFDFASICEIILEKRFNNLMEFFAKDAEIENNVILLTSSETGRLPEFVRDEFVRLYEDNHQMNKDEFLKYLDKIRINCLYGKGIQRREMRQAKAVFGKGNIIITPEISKHAAAVIRYQMKKAIINNETIYWDTDGIKVKNNEDAVKFFERQNEKILNKNARAGYPECKIGTWKFEGHFDELLVMREKKYIMRDGDKFIMKWSGMPQSLKNELIEGSKNIIKDILLHRKLEYTLQIPIFNATGKRIELKDVPQLELFTPSE